MSLRHAHDRSAPHTLTYLATLLVISLTSGGLYLLREVVNPSSIALLYLLPVGVSTFFWGLGPGILAALLAFLALNYFFIPPYYTLFVHQTQDLLALLVFGGTAVAINQLVGRIRQGLADATERERDAIMLYELSSTLAGLHEDQTILRALAAQAHSALRTRHVQVIIEKQAGQQALQFDLPQLSSGTAANLPARPDCIIPLQSSHRLLGEVRLWTENNDVSTQKERLLRAFANQAVLALERAQLARSEARAQVLEESDRLKTSLLSSVSHELRTPLATIKASVSSLLSGAVDWDSAARHDLLAVIEEETDHLNQLVGNLLNMSRIEAGALQLERTWNTFPDIIQDALRRLRQRSKELDGMIQAHFIEVDAPEDLPLLPVDYTLIEQVFTNLISNSLKYSPEHTMIKIRAWPSGQDTLEVTVSNQGPPVAEEHLGRIFDKFYRVTAADRITGTGLGLSICKGIIEAHGGRIWAENLRDGFAFHFTIPLTWEGVQVHVPIE